MNNYLSGIPELLLLRVDPHLRYCIFTFLTCILPAGWSLGFREVTWGRRVGVVSFSESCGLLCVQ
jgi:hypothetical protein